MKKIIQLQDLQPGTKYLVRARVVNQYSVVSEWSQTYEVSLVSDDLKPSKPAKPTIQIAGPQKVVVSHDNTKQGGGNLEFDVVSYKVHTSTTLTNIGGTLIHTMSATRPGSGISSFATINVNSPLVDDAGQTLYFYVTAVDSAGNESDPSDATTGTPITYFDSAYISDLTADRIRTGTLQANQSISVGTTAPIIIKSNSSSPRGQIYIGTTTDPTGAVGSGYKDIQTAFYVDSTGKFSLKDQLYWDGTTLTIEGVLKVGEAEGDITTISGDKVRTGNLISNNYVSNVSGQPQAQSTSYTNDGTWIDLDDGTIYSKNFYIDPQGSAVFRGNIFGSRGIFHGELPVDQIPGLQNPEGARVPTLIVESTNTDDGYLVFFKNAGTDNGVEFYVKQGAAENDINWRRGSLAHLDDVSGGFLRLGAFPSSTGLTPGRMRLFAESSGNKQGEIYLDARRTFVQKIFLTEPSTTGDWASDPVTNFWKDPDFVSNGQDYFKVGSTTSSAIVVRKKSDGTDKVVIKDFEIEGVTSIIDDSKITVNTVEIGKGVGGAGKHGIKINDNNYWYDPTPSTFGDTEIVFRAGGGGNNALVVRKNGSVSFEGETNPTGGTIRGTLSITNTGGTNNMLIGKNVSGTNDGLYFNAQNYWYINGSDGSTFAFRAGGTSRFIAFTGGASGSLSIATDSITISGAPGATQQYATDQAGLAVANFSLVDKWNGSISGVSLLASGIIRSIKNGVPKVYEDSTSGWVLDSSQTLPRFDIGNGTKYLRWDGSQLIVSGNIISGSSVGDGVSIPGGEFATHPTYGAGIGLAGNRLFLTNGYQNGIIAFSDGISTSYGSLGPAVPGKFSGFETNSKAIMIGQSGYPQIEIGKDSSNNNKILLYTSATVGLEIRPSNFIIRGGSSSRIRGIPSSASAPAGKKVLYGDEDLNLEWGPASGGSGGSVPTGTITMYGGANAPSGWLFCDGSSYNTSTYNALWNVVGYSYGGSGSLFNVPNFNNRFPRQGANRDTGRGVSGGQNSFTLTESNIPSHSHGSGTLATNLAGSHSHGSGTLATNLAGSHSHAPGTLSTNNSGAHTDTNTTYTFGTASNTTANASSNRLTSSSSANSNQNVASHSHIVNSGTTGTESSHSHIVNSGNTGTESSHSHIVNSGNTGNWGSATPNSIDNRPEFLQVNFIIKT